MVSFTTLLSITTALALSKRAAQPGKASTFCILRHCNVGAVACTLNPNCNKVLACSNSCNENLDCSERCVTQFGIPQFDALSVCINDNQCITPYPTINFPVPSKRAAFGVVDFAGTWVTLAGLDVGLDCYTSQSMSFTPITDTTWNQELMIDFPEGTKTFNSTLVAQAQSGLFDLSYTAGGGGLNNWHVLLNQEDWILVVYLGANRLANYRGGYVLARSRITLSTLDIEMINKALDESATQLTWKNFCPLT
jgi:hypothetical protein